MTKVKVAKVNKLAIAERVYKLFGGKINKNDSEMIVDVCFDQIVENITLGSKVLIAGFGIFSRRERKEKVARNPRTGEKVTVPAHFTVKFAPVKALKEELNK